MTRNAAVRRQMRSGVGVGCGEGFTKAMGKRTKGAEDVCVFVRFTKCALCVCAFYVKCVWGGCCESGEGNRTTGERHADAVKRAGDGTTSTLSDKLNIGCVPASLGLECGLAAGDLRGRSCDPV
eukprot:6194715-Pleurochrysis_carterae.AAC.5